MGESATDPSRRVTLAAIPLIIEQTQRPDEVPHRRRYMLLARSRALVFRSLAPSGPFHSGANDRTAGAQSASLLASTPPLDLAHLQSAVTLGWRRGLKIGRAHMRPALRTPIIAPHSRGRSLEYVSAGSRTRIGVFRLGSRQDRLGDGFLRQPQDRSRLGKLSRHQRPHQIADWCR